MMPSHVFITYSKPTPPQLPGKFVLREAAICGRLQSVLLRGHSKMTSPPKCQILDPLLPFVTVSHFFHYTPSPPCHQANNDKLFA